MVRERGHGLLGRRTGGAGCLGWLPGIADLCKAGRYCCRQVGRECPGPRHFHFLFEPWKGPLKSNPYKKVNWPLEELSLFGKGKKSNVMDKKSSRWTVGCEACCCCCCSHCLSFGCQGLPATGLSGFLHACYRMVDGEHFMSYQVLHRVCNCYYHLYY